MSKKRGFLLSVAALGVLLCASPLYAETTCAVEGVIVAPGFAWDKFVEVLQIREYHLMNYAYADGSGKFRLPALNNSDYYDIVVRIEGYADYRERIVAFGCRSPEQRTFYMEREPIPILPLVLDFSGEVNETVDVSELRKTVPSKILKEFENARKDRTRNEVARARRRLEGIVREAPDFYDAHNVLGTVYLELKMFREAEKEFNRAREIKPKSAAPLISLGSLYVQEAEAIIDMGRGRGTVALLQGDLGIVLDDARGVLIEAVRVRPDASFAHYLLGITAFYGSDYATAEELFNRALDIEPRLRWARLGLANLYIRQGKWQKALVELDAYIEAFPKVLNRRDIEATRAKIAERL